MTLDNGVDVDPAAGEVPVLPPGKARKTRRGKKRRQGRDDEDGLPESPIKKSPKQRSNQVMIRPVQVPKAPANFTQFIIDDHENCALYQSFEEPQFHKRLDDGSDDEDSEYKGEDNAGFSPCSRVLAEGEEVPESSFPAGEDYESLDYRNIFEFYEKDFETVYKDARVDELLQVPRTEVVEMYWALERRATELCDQLHRWDPQNCLDELQQQLLRLQEENEALLQLNATLRASAAEFTSSSGQEEPAYDSDHTE